MNTKSILTYSLGSLVSLALAGGLWFFGSELIGDVPKNPVQDEEMIADNGSEGTVYDENGDSISVEPEYNVCLNINGPAFNVRYRNYEVRPSASLEGCDTARFQYLVFDDQNNYLKTETKKVFALDATASGKYYLLARETTTGKESDKLEITGCTVRKMSKSRLEQICNSGNYRTQTNEEAYDYNPNLILKFEPSSEFAYSISEVCSAIDMGIWQEVKVRDIKYDNLGRIKEVKFNVVM